MIFLITAIFLVIALLDFPELIRQKKWPEFTALCILFISAFGMAALQAYNVTIPSPMKGVEYVINDLLHLKFVS